MSYNLGNHYALFQSQIGSEVAKMVILADTLMDVKMTYMSIYTKLFKYVFVIEN